ncbi:MAG: DUF4268 domain-containing protein [Crocinitomicaceae bacterium]|nr:DUF4268 domain-containing protein [Crocinitomicaceae bacterium]
MLSKEELREKNIAFWGGFKAQFKKVNSCCNKRINWLSYPTGSKELFVRLQADSRSCSLNFDIQCKDDGVREVVWEQMNELKVVLSEIMEDEGDWIENYTMPEGFTISRIRWEQPELNYYNKEDVAKMYDFLKNKLIAFDEFYQEYNDILLNLLN